jgi:hypothetical protein
MEAPTVFVAVGQSRRPPRRASGWSWDLLPPRMGSQARDAPDPGEDKGPVWEGGPTARLCPWAATPLFGAPGPASEPA